MIKAIAKLVIALNGNVKSSQIAAGFAWGLLLALTPVGIIWVVLFVVSFLFKHNHASKVLLTVILKLLSPLIAIPVDLAGWEILHIEALTPLFTTLYNTPFVPFTRFNNTLVAGGLFLGAVFWLPVFFLFKALIPLYRRTLAPKILNSKIMQIIKNFPLVSKIIHSVESLSGMTGK